MSARQIPDYIRNTQARAADPAISAFVSANAGSGKTHVLVQRVIRLLLGGTPPEKILCITFTKAAAANMAERVFKTLSDWIRLDDPALDARLVDAGIAHPDARTRKRARELFASALETPGGLKVQTIHALCTRLLQQFPFEANVPVHFTVLDERDQADMIERASLATLLDAAARPDSATGQALAFAMTMAADSTFRDIVRTACLFDEPFRTWLDRAGTLEAARAQLSRALQIEDEQSSLDFARLITREALPPHRCMQIAALLRASPHMLHGPQADRLEAASIGGWPDSLDDYAEFFLSADGSAKADQHLAGKEVRKDHAALFVELAAERDRLVPLMAHLRQLRIRDRTMALAAIAASVLAYYRREKNERGLLDYDDLIDRTLAMLERTAAGWVHYKLDRGIDHVLIDEAQDTSPRQWDIVAYLTDDFTSGAGARGAVERTMFAVGDEKQSIFSFQGAVPHEFDSRHQQFRMRFEQAGLRWDRDIRLNFSFRSGSTILNAVDGVFREQEIYRSIQAAESGYPIHEALADAAPSVVELWPLIEKDDRAEIEGWQAPFDAVSESDPEVRLARRMAREIKSLLDGNTFTGRADERRPLRAGDVMVLVRRRGKLFNSVIQALKHASVPVAGADRLKLTEHIAIIDLMNLADAILLRQDDLALACALKSPLFGLDEETLFSLAHERTGSLRDAIAERAASDPPIAEIDARLARYEAAALQTSPFAFYAHLLGADGGRRRILQRLSHEANDALDEFLELALRFGQRGPATLQGFVAWLRASETEIKRDMEVSRDEVRVMTVHGAKGLEAPVVFLTDSTVSPTDAPRLSLIRLPPATDRADDASCVVWAGKKTDDPPVVAAARQRMVREMEDEYRRLLYVAMTRAAERLVVGGAMPGNRSTPRKDWWYQLIASGLDRADFVKQEVATADGAVVRYCRTEEVVPAQKAYQLTLSLAEGLALPSWLHQPATPGRVDFETARPSSVGRTILPSSPQAESRRKALERGTLVHRLLQSLPAVAAANRREAGDAFLQRNAGDWSSAEREAMLARTLALIDGPAAASLFAPGSLAEAPIAGRIERPGRPPLLVSGQIDRLAIEGGTIVIADYKTNAVPPTALDGIPQSYLRQLALYRAVLRRLYPEKAVKALLIWTEGPEIMEIPPAMLDREISQIISP